MPWGNRSLLFRDPDGNLINFFTPVSAEAIKKFNNEVGIVPRVGHPVSGGYTILANVDRFAASTADRSEP